jgi:hypothetical protein
MMWHRKKDEGGNSGIQNSGYMSNVQNQPGATGSSQTQGAPASGAQDLAKITALLSQLRQALADEHAHVENYQKSVDLLDETAQLQLNDAESRTIATGMLTRIRQLCSGAPSVLALVASTLDLITAMHQATG